MSISTLVRNFPLDRRLTRDESAQLIHIDNIEPLLGAAATRRDAAHGRQVSYSGKVFIPLTQLCRDVCHYCTFAHAPRADENPCLSIDQMVAIAQAGKKAGCKEALFTLGDKPAGVNDLGGTLMDESISRSAGASYGQEMTPQEMEEIILSSGRVPRQRTTLHSVAEEGDRRRSFEAAAARMSVNDHGNNVRAAGRA
jgi:2-iminoacetate synthase ThiH